MVRKLGRGDQVKIAAKDYNRWQDAGLAHAMARLNQSEIAVPPESLEGIILVKNTTAMHLPRFSILGLDGSIYDPTYDAQQRTEFKNQIALKGEMPGSEFSGKFCVLQNDARPGEVVAAMVSGVTPCWLNVEATTDTHADVETDTGIADRTRYLKTGTSGSGYILFKPPGLLGEQLGVVRISNRANDGDGVDIVKVYHSGSDVGADVAANASGVHPGLIKRVVDGVMTEVEECWILFVDDYDTEAGTIKAKNGDYYGPARLSGEFTHSAVTLPLYVLRRNFERIVHFELTSTLALSGDAEAIILSDDDADWADTALAIQVYDWFSTEGMWAGTTGYRGYALRREGLHASGRQKYDVIWMEQLAQTIQFTSTEYMGASTANRMAASVNWYDHQGKDPGSSVTLRDPQGQFPDVHSGAKGTAVYDYHNGYYRIISSQRVALFASASLSADSCGSSMSVSSFSARATGDYVGSPPTAPTSVTNSCAHAGLSGDSVLLRRTNNSMPNPGWEVVDVSKHAKDVIVDVQVTGLTLQKKTIAIYAEVCTTTAPSWVTWHTGDECA